MARNKRITVFGATGKIGQEFIAQTLSLNAGHKITAFTRSPHKIEAPHRDMKVIDGDVRNYQDVKEAISNNDLVVCALGMPLMNKEGLRAMGTKNIVDAMGETGVKRLICLSAFGSGDSYKFLPASYKHVIAPLFMRRLFADHNAQEALVMNSDLDWTIVRPASFIKGKATGNYWQGSAVNGQRLKVKISQGDVADFLVKQISNDNNIGKTPILSYLK